ncbi:MAG: hypothetical protein KIT84_24500 [Labilithrix sp.]|nr:hypothetical protein [Labilithrix sp.]
MVDPGQPAGVTSHPTSAIKSAQTVTIADAVTTKPPFAAAAAPAALVALVAVAVAVAVAAAAALGEATSATTPAVNAAVGALRPTALANRSSTDSFSVARARSRRFLMSRDRVPVRVSQNCCQCRRRRVSQNSCQ